MSFPRYEAYRDSGVEWLGEVPEHWTVASLARVTVEKCDGPFGSGLKSAHYVDSGVRVVRLQNIRHGVFDDADEAFIDEGYFRRALTRHEVNAGDLLIAGLGDERNTVGRACIAPTTIEPAIVKADCFRFRVDRGVAVPEFLAAQLTAGSAADAGLLASGSTRQRITLSLMASRTIALPPIPEQQAIIAFICRETNTIDSLIAEQHRLIALLAEKRQAVILQVVTKGLDPDTPTKDSGVEWLREVPAHWRIVRLGNLLQDVSEPGDEDLPVLSVSIHDGVSDREFGEEEMTRKIVRSEDRTKYKRVRPGDLVYNMMRAWQGAFGTVVTEGMVSPAYVVARPRNGCDAAFIEQVLRTPNAITEMRRHSQGVTDFRLRLYWDAFKDLRIALPPPVEVAHILSAIAQLSTSAATLTEAAERAIVLLQERRAALISAAVTGKIDVRGLVDAEAVAA